ncbi:Trp biosynthesis-associated membrane protein [Nocardioides panacisoli]|uniref:Trp biosynthesis-associated membrane protein n=1 Tax=Nocardioides panacisoli TaxID=627624 RepID=UPI001C62C4AD|nr:Trp biosynthesis-associated membrane protein [Nocardioides panacisoli]QYJ04763.1 Trp biosynthesis-associated membrane protein [Nocardioides panacisoli]
MTAAEATGATDPPRGRRRTFVPALLVGLLAGAVAAVAGNQAWVEPASDSPAGSIGQVAAIAADASSPLTTAVALVSLATWGVVLVTRDRFRRVMAWFGALVAVALLVVVVLGLAAAPDDLRDLMAQYGITEPDLRRTPWSWVALAATPFALAAALAAARDVRHWPQMGSRYDAPSAPDTATADDDPAEEQSHLELWKSLDEGSDPTR